MLFEDSLSDGESSSHSIRLVSTWEYRVIPGIQVAGRGAAAAARPAAGRRSAARRGGRPPRRLPLPARWGNAAPSHCLLHQINTNQRHEFGVIFGKMETEATDDCDFFDTKNTQSTQTDRLLTTQLLFFL